jgi:DNA-binding transcriptional ArsR family regulator
MDKAHLKELLEELHTELTKTNDLDPGAAELLRNLRADIEALLEETPDEPHHQSVADRLSEAVEKFEESHPSLTLHLTRLSEAIGRIAH